MAFIRNLINQGRINVVTYGPPRGEQIIHDAYI
jgi:hypothetical protein